MSYREQKIFTFVNPPTGVAVKRLVDENDLHDWIVKIERITNEPGRYSAITNLYRYDVTFERYIR